jgi:hypothetical protein
LFFGKSQLSIALYKRIKGKNVFLPFPPFDFFDRVFGRFSAWGAKKKKVGG